VRLTKAWTIASKDFKTFTKRITIIYTIVVFEVLVSIALPLLVRYISSKAGRAAVLPNFIDAFSYWFVIGAALLPVTIASYSLIGEKVQKSLEPLLATPTTDEEILAGKGIAAFLPAIGASYVGAVIFMVLVDIFTSGILGYVYYPNWNMAVILLLLAPLACLLSVGYNVLISSRVNDVRTAQQVGALIILPLAAVYFLTEFGAITLTTNFLLIMAACLAAVDVIVFFLVRATFQREEILTKWK
jgi:ABC-2 type transport system permease protein